MDSNANEPWSLGGEVREDDGEEPDSVLDGVSLVSGRKVHPFVGMNVYVGDEAFTAASHLVEEALHAHSARSVVQGTRAHGAEVL